MKCIISTYIDSILITFLNALDLKDKSALRQIGTWFKRQIGTETNRHCDKSEL